MLIESAKDGISIELSTAHRAVATNNSRVNFTAWQAVKMTQRRTRLEQQYGYERGLSLAVSSDARARASRSAPTMEPLPRGNQAMPAARTTARNTIAVARLNRIPSMKSLSATARIAFCVAGLRCLIGRPGPISAE